MKNSAVTVVSTAMVQGDDNVYSEVVCGCRDEADAQEFIAEARANLETLGFRPEGNAMVKRRFGEVFASEEYQIVSGTGLRA